MVRPPVCISPQRACISVFLVLVSAVLAWAGPAKAPAEPRESIVAIGDVHNAFDDFVAILRRTGLIDNQNHWTGGKTTFVQVGDLLDRGPKPREVMDLMMALEKEAAQALLTYRRQENGPPSGLYFASARLYLRPPGPGVCGAGVGGTSKGSGGTAGIHSGHR